MAPPSGFRRAVVPVGLLLGLLLLGLRASTLRLVEIVGDSDAPVLQTGDLAVFDCAAYALWGWQRRAISPGELVLFTDPEGQLSTKHVERVDEEGVFLVGRNAAVSRDSRHYGPVPQQAVHGRLLWRWTRAP